MSRPPSGLPVISSHTQTANTAAVNAIRRTSIILSLRRDERRREQAASTVGRIAARQSRYSTFPSHFFSQRRSPPGPRGRAGEGWPRPHRLMGELGGDSTNIAAHRAHSEELPEPGGPRLTAHAVG
jgi:hypothetical protein